MKNSKNTNFTQNELSIIEDNVSDYAKRDEFLGEYKEQPVKPQHIHTGSKVIMTRKYPVSNEIIGRIWTVLSEPKFVNGSRQVRLDGYRGTYPADGLKVVG